MNCEKCESSLSYGAKYCNKCGEKVSGTYDEEYKKTAWGKIDRIKDWYDNLFFKKITGNWIFKSICLVALLGYLFFTMYGNLTGIRLKDSDAYEVQYNKKINEYYICNLKGEALLELYAPIGTDGIVFTAVSDGQEAEVKKYTVEQYKKEGYKVTNGQYDYIGISALRNGKTADQLKIVIVDK